MTNFMRDIRRHEAKMIAEELYSLLKNDCKKVVQQVAETETDEYLDMKEAAALLKCSPWTLYRKKDTAVGAYTKIGNKLRFRKSVLLKAIYEGKFKGDNV